MKQEASSEKQAKKTIQQAEAADFPKFEAEMLKLWDQEKTFEASLKQRQGAKRFRFYDGPPFTSGPPHYGHVEQSSIKDAVVRYKTMQGYYVPRRTGVDTHGLPIEYQVEKELGFKGKQDIIKYGIAKFNQACREVVFRHKSDFDELYHRLGRWDNPKESYATLDDDYIESVWWVFAEIYRRGLVYQSFKSMPYCPRCATPLSNFEVNDGYRDNVPDPSVYVKFRLADDPKTALISWTTTPWTLPANAALAVDRSADYVTVELPDGAKLILAKSRLMVLGLKPSEYKVVKTQKGKALEGQRYLPLFELVKPDQATSKQAYRIYHDDSVDLAEGTGILHVAPRYGETDLAIGQREGLPLFESVDGTGHMTEAMGQFKGRWFKEADPAIIQALTEADLVWAAETIEHTYPFCWRCETPLLYFATPSWFVRVSAMQSELVKAGQKTTWVPGHVKPGRFIKWLENARDWAISRNRFWGAPLPIWVNPEDLNDIIVVGSLDELRKLSGAKSFDLHRPGIDAVVIKRDGKTYRRVEEVFDCWFESGSMPYGQDHYPFEHKAEFETSFPADFITEAIEQVHLWFYTLHVLATALFDQPAYQNVVASGLILGADGRKLSKRLRNYQPVEEVFDRYGADTLRFFILSSPLMAAGDTRLSDDGLRDVQRQLLATIWNVYSFFSTYAAVDGWQPANQLAEPQPDNLLDQWILSRLNQTMTEVTKGAEGYQLMRATRPILELVDDLSNWYVRRNRRRFWKSQDDADKASAYQTLHYVMIRLSQLLAPWAPFISDKIYRQLSAGMDLPASVHLTDWPKPGPIDPKLLQSMEGARQVVKEGLAQRAEAKIKVRQPLSEVKIAGSDKLPTELLEVVAEELNVKKIVQQSGSELKVTLNTKITQDLEREGLAREVIRRIQEHRKQAGLAVNDRISLTLETSDSNLSEAIKSHQALIQAETLASQLQDAPHHGDIVPIKIGPADLNISLRKA